MPEGNLPVASRIDFRTYAASSTIAPHEHSSPSLTVVLSGWYEERIIGRHTEQRAGSLSICPAETLHAQAFGGHTTRKFVVTPSAELLDYLKTTTPFASAPTSRAKAIRTLALQIDAERSHGDAFSKVAMEGVLWQMAALLGRDLAGANRSEATIVRRARRMIEEQDTPVSIAALSRETDCHPATLTRAFRREHGCTPGAYQRGLQVERAARLLRDTKTPLAEVAAACGFCDQSHMTRSFRRIIGCTPAQYRRERA